LASTVSIRRSLLTNLIPIVLLLGIGIFVMMALRTRSAVQELSGAIIQQASRRTEVKLQGFFQPVRRQVEVMRTWGETGILDLSAPDQTRQVLIPLMSKVPWRSAAFIANEQGIELDGALAPDERVRLDAVDVAGVEGEDAEPSTGRQHACGFTQEARITVALEMLVGTVHGEHVDRAVVERQLAGIAADAIVVNPLGEDEILSIARRANQLCENIGER